MVVTLRCVWPHLLARGNAGDGSSLAVLRRPRQRGWGWDHGQFGGLTLLRAPPTLALFMLADRWLPRLMHRHHLEGQQGEGGAAVLDPL